MSLLVPPRAPSHELLDDPTISSEEMARSLRDLWLVNRWWGGGRALERFILDRYGREGTPRLVVLDVGAGSGHVVRRLAWRLSAAGLAVRAIASDLQWRHLAAGRRMMRQAPPALCADAFRLPFGDRSVDWVISTLLLHHFSPEENLVLLRELARVARTGVALLDLRRHRVPLAFVVVAGSLLFESPVSVADGKASVRQAYTPAEAGDFARRALGGARVERVFPFRMLIGASTR